MRVMARQSQIQHPSNMRVLFQPLSQLHRILAMLPHPQTQRLQALQEEESSERIKTGTNLTKVLRPHRGRVSCRTKRLDELEPVIAFTGICEPRELS